MGHPGQIDATQDLGRSEGQAEQVVAVLDGYLAALKAGERPDREQLLAAHPEIREQLEACLAGIEFIHSGKSGGQPSGKRLGEFRIIREIGHGGMGAVYEAEQISLGRRVALKVLRFGPVSDPEAIQRFQREAETIARLHHTNIVPIFDVGSEHGVNYYAMQYILGRSLDQMLREEGKPLDPHTVAQWGLQAAEALAHAHARGVIHRDVKPSNLLVDDEEGRIWLTDFGLAKRLDDVTLSMTGALLGTPRYMSPEQAMAAHNKLDHRTDLYSLGATLYELATNKPVFTGDTPHDVISQIIARDPVPPRQHRPSLPRDLETILMKCLAKESSQRYASAAHLTDDLRAFLDGRPISARRTSLVELAGRWVRQQQRSLLLTIGAVAATLLLVVAATAGRYFWQRSQLAFMRLDTDRPPVVAEILDGSGASVTPKTTVPMQQPIEVARGEYKLRLTTDQRLSQDYDVLFTPGQQLHQKLDVEDQLLWSDFKYARTYRLITVREQDSSLSKTDLLVLNVDTVQRIDGATREVKWEENLVQPTHQLLTKDVRILWPWDRNHSIGTHGVGVFDQRPYVVSVSDAPDAKSSFDFNSDGTTDVLIAARHQAWVIALSGKDGTPLWVVARGDAKPLPEGQAWPPYGSYSGLPYPPLNVGDRDGDGVADFAVWFMTTPTSGTPVTRTLELISGASGTMLWSYEPLAEWFALADGVEPPLDFRWFHGSGGGYSSGGSGSSWSGHLTRRGASRLARHGNMAYAPSSAVLLAGSEPNCLVVACGTQLVRLDAKTGKDLESPAMLSVRPSLRPRWADFDGDGQLDLLLAEQLPDLPAPKGGMDPIPQLQLSVWSPGKQQELWRKFVEASLPLQPEMNVEAPNWPVAEDLDGDGASELIVPTSSSNVGFDWKPPYGVLSVLSGRSGEPKWERQLRNIDQQLDTFTVGPDINGDGQREVYVASLWNEDYRLFLDCLSGADGTSLWRTVERTVAGNHNNEEHHLMPLTWYTGCDGAHPQLLVRLPSGRALQSSLVGLFSSQDGKQARLASGIGDAQAADFDGDGVTDLLLTRPANFQHTDEGGALHVMRGMVRESWRRLGHYTQPTFDFNADGITDLLESSYGRQYTARCGGTGKPLWTAELTDIFSVQQLPATDADPNAVLAAQDFNRDGTCDVVLLRTNGHYGDGEPVAVALSGVDGRTLWRSEATCAMMDRAVFSDVRDLDGDGEAEVTCVLPMDYDRIDRNSWSVHDERLWLVVMSGRTGKTRFLQKLVPSSPQNATLRITQLWLEATYADLNRDGTLDLLLPGLKSGTLDQLEMQAINGKDGARLWQHPLPPDQQKHEALSSVWPATAGDVDGDGQPEVVIGSLTDVPSGEFGTRTMIRAVLLDGATGKQRWQQDLPSDRYYARVDEDQHVVNRARPILLRRGNKQQWIALLSLNHKFTLQILDEEGKVVVDRNLHTEQIPISRPHRLWACDVDGDERDELVLFENQSLRVVRPEEFDKPLWSSPRLAWQPGSVKGLLRSPQGLQLLLQGGHGGTSLFGLAAATGQTLWTCVAPGAQLGNNAALLRHPAEAVVPIAFFHNNNVTVIREGSQENQSSPPSASLPPTVLVEHDPRLLRDLPWRSSPHVVVEGAWMFVWSSFYAITLIAIPMTFVVSLLVRRKWGMRTMLLFPVVAAVVLMGLLTPGPGEGEFRTLLGKYVLALLSAPVLVAAFILGRWIWQRKFVSVAVWLSVGLVLGLLIFSALLLGIYPKFEGPLASGERWSWEGWYWVFFPCYLFTAWAITLLVPLWWAINAMRHVCRSPRKLAPQ